MKCQVCTKWFCSDPDCKKTLVNRATRAKNKVKKLVKELAELRKEMERLRKIKHCRDCQCSAPKRREYFRKRYQENRPAMLAAAKERYWKTAV